MKYNVGDLVKTRNDLNDVQNIKFDDVYEGTLVKIVGTVHGCLYKMEKLRDEKYSYAISDSDIDHEATEIIQKLMEGVVFKHNNGYYRYRNGGLEFAMVLDKTDFSPAWFNLEDIGGDLKPRFFEIAKECTTITVREMLERVTNGNETYIEIDGKKHLIFYTGIQLVVDDLGKVVDLSELFDYNYYVDNKKPH